MIVEHVNHAGRKVHIQIDRRDAAMLQRGTWRTGRQGVCELRGEKRWLHRIIAKAADDEQVRFRDGNRFNVQRENLTIRRSRNYSATGRRKRSTPDGTLTGITFNPTKGGEVEVRAAVFILGREHVRVFTTSTLQGVGGVKLTRTEAYRRAVCWRIGMLLAHGEAPDKSSLDHFFAEHPRLCPFPRPFYIQKLGTGRARYVHARVGQLARKVERKAVRRNFGCGADIEEAMRKAIFWVVGTLLHEDLMPDEHSIELLKKALAYYYTAPLPEEMYVGNAEYRDQLIGDDEGPRYRTARAVAHATGYE